MELGPLLHEDEARFPQLKIVACSKGWSLNERSPALVRGRPEPSTEEGSSLVRYLGKSRGRVPLACFVFGADGSFDGSRMEPLGGKIDAVPHLKQTSWKVSCVSSSRKVVLSPSWCNFLGMVDRQENVLRMELIFCLSGHDGVT